MQNDKYEFDVLVKRKTDKAVLIDDGTMTAWLPLSQIRTEDEIEFGKTITIEIPEWLAEEKELV